MIETRTMRRELADPEPGREFARPDVPKLGAGFENMVAQQHGFAQAFARWLATLHDSTIESASAFANRLHHCPAGKWAKLERGKGAMMLWFLDPEGKRQVGLSAGGMASPYSGYTVAGAGKDHVALLHVVAALAAEPAAAPDSGRAERRAAASYRAGESVGEALCRYGFRKGEQG